MSVWQAYEASIVAAKRLEWTILLVQDDPVEFEWVHVIVPVFVHKLLVVVPVQLVVLVLVTAKPRE